jgi:hypothetical protein
MAKTSTVDVGSLTSWRCRLFERFESLEEWTDEGHSLRSALALGIVYTILGCTIGLFVVKPLLMLLVLVWNMRRINWRNGLNPLVWGKNGWPLQRKQFGDSPHSSRWTQDKYGSFYHPVLKWYNPPTALYLFLFAWSCTSGDVLHWSFLDVLYHVGPFLLMGLMVVYAITALSLFRRWLNKPRRPEPKFTRP